MPVLPKRSEADLLAFIRDNSFCTLVTCVKNKLFTSHINLIQLKDGSFFGHLAAKNHQATHLQNGDNILAIFKNSSTPNDLINTVHLQGTVEIISDEETLTDMLSKLTSKYETGRCPQWTIDWADPKYKSRLTGIIGFKITPNLLEEALFQQDDIAFNLASPQRIASQSTPDIMPLYTPHWFSEQSPKLLTEFINVISSCTLVLCSDTGLLHVYHLNQVLLEHQRSNLGISAKLALLCAPEFLNTKNRLRALLIFSGAHTYISPTLYKTAHKVPTWSYVVIHAQGIARILNQQHSGSELSLELKFDIEKLYGKFKLDQKYGKKDRQGVLDGLDASSCPADYDIAQLMKSSTSK